MWIYSEQYFLGICYLITLFSQIIEEMQKASNATDAFAANSFLMKSVNSFTFHPFSFWYLCNEWNLRRQRHTFGANHHAHGRCEIASFVGFVFAFAYSDDPWMKCVWFFVTLLEGVRGEGGVAGGDCNENQCILCINLKTIYLNNCIFKAHLNMNCKHLLIVNVSLVKLQLVFID